VITRKALRKQAERFCFQDTHLHEINRASICMLGPSPSNYLLWANLFIIAVKGIIVLKASLIAVILYVIQLSCVTSNAGLCDMHTFELDRHLCRRGDGE
jgi:hypothetical protein